MSTMSYTQLHTSVKNDPFNERNGRNRHNTPKGYYNCGGYALSTYNWVCPYNTKTDAYKDWSGLRRDLMMDSLCEEGKTDEEIEDIIFKLDVEYLLKTYPFLQRVNLEDVPEDETVIAYRLFVNSEYELDSDFHFRVRYHGFWFEKQGTSKVTLCDSYIEDPWYMNEDTIYDSQIAFFITKKDVVL